MITEHLTVGERRTVRHAFKIQRRKAVIELAGASGNVSKT
jgi:hypothetical protein